MAEDIATRMGDADQRVRAIVGLVSQFSVQITQPVDDVMGTDDAKNEEMRLLVALTTAGPHTTRSLSAHSGLSRDASSKLVRRLADAGLVTRAPSAEDRRAVAVSLTRRGRRRIDQLRVTLEQVFVDAHDLAVEVAALAAANDEPADAPRWDPPRDALELLDLIAVVGSQISDASLRHSHDEPVVGRQLLALLQLQQPGDHRPAQLAAGLGLTTGGGTYVLDQLEARGLIERHHNTPNGDRRGITVTITDTGHLAASPTNAAITDMSPTLAALFDAIARYTAQARDDTTKAPAGRARERTRC